MNGPYERSGPDEAEIEALLQEVGAREEPAMQVAEDVQAIVHAEWLEVVRQRRRRRRLTAWSLAASFLLVVTAATFGLRLMTMTAEPVATIAYIDGSMRAIAQGTSGDTAAEPSGLDAGPGAIWKTRAAGDPVARGETLRTDRRSRAALRLGGLSLRLDHGTTLHVLGDDLLALTSGALYVDAPPGAPDTPLTVRTSAGSVRHLGTQYQVRTEQDIAIVSVREGRVDIESAAGTSTGVAGERILIDSEGQLSRGTISPQDAAWSWAQRAAPPFDIDDRPLSLFLSWAARETGRELIYTSPQARTLASELRMRGSIAGLDLDTALGAVLATTPLQRMQSSDERIEIALSPRQ